MKSRFGARDERVGLELTSVYNLSLEIMFSTHLQALQSVLALAHPSVALSLIVLPRRTLTRPLLGAEFAKGESDTHQSIANESLMHIIQLNRNDPSNSPKLLWLLLESSPATENACQGDDLSKSAVPH